MKEEDLKMVERILLKLKPNVTKILKLASDLDEYISCLLDEDYRLDKNDNSKPILDVYSIIVDFRSCFSILEMILMYFEWHVKNSDSIEDYKKLNEVFFRVSMEYRAVLNHLKNINGIKDIQEQSFEAICNFLHKPKLEDISNGKTK